jgi:tripartite-type tricarboxylate transporter receptor subunit TctC
VPITAIGSTGAWRNDAGAIMKLPRRNFLFLAAGAMPLPTVSRIAMAQTYPSRPVHLIVGFAAGGGYDIVARLMAQWLSERLGQQFVIENRPGAATNVATEVVARAPADGYTLLFVGLSNAITAILHDTVNFNFIRDIAPVAGIIGAPLVMVVNPSVPAKTVREFIAYAKANPGKVNMGSAGTGSGGHLAGELLKMMADIDMVHVPFRGVGPALTGALAAHHEHQRSEMPAHAARPGMGWPSPPPILIQLMVPMLCRRLHSLSRFPIPN